MKLRAWIEETHSAGFELRRHFFLRFFDSELIADPAQAKVIAGGALGILLSTSLIFSQAYYHKYRVLLDLPTPDLYRRASLADVLFLITLAMSIAALFTILQWPALFPGLRDYLALAAMPLRTHEIFLAKFSALLAFAAAVIAGASLPPSVIVPAMMGGRYGAGTVWHIPGIFFGSFFGGMFIFFTLVAVQGVLLNILPVRLFQRCSLAMQGLLLATLVGGLPLVFSIPDLYDRIDPLPSWTRYAPPAWFFGIDQMMFANPAAAHLTRTAAAAFVASAVAAILSYLWSYRRHRVRVLESPSAESAGSRAYWPGALSDRLLADPRALGVFRFIGKSLARSRQHRLFLTGFGAVALAVIAEGFASLALTGGRFHAISTASEGVRQAVIAIPLALSLFLLGGFRYLFRLPVELRANWQWRITEPGHAAELLLGVERFLLWWGALPVALLTLPIETVMLGLRAGASAAMAAFLISLLLLEFLLLTFEKIPFTSSYLPAQRPLIETLVKLSAGSIGYVWGFAAIVSFATRSMAGTLALIAMLAAAAWRLHRVRLSSREIRRLEFEEALEPAVQLLGLERE